MTNRLEDWARTLEQEADIALAPLGGAGVSPQALARTRLAVRRAALGGARVAWWNSLIAGGIAAAVALLIFPGVRQELRGRSDSLALRDVSVALQDWSDSLLESGRTLGRMPGEDEGSRPSDDEFRDLRDSLDESLDLLGDV